MDPNNNQPNLIERKDEKKLFSKIKNNDQESFIKAYDLYVDDVYRFVYFKIRGNKEEAEDITSSVFLKTWNYIQNNNLKDFKTLRALIYKIARNTIIDHYRKNSKINQVDIDSGDQKIDIPATENSALEKMEIVSDFQIVESQLGELKDEYREVIILRYINELSIAEISKVVDKSKGNVRVIISRAIKSLRDLVGDELS